MFPFELKKGEKLISLIFISKEEDIYQSFICKNSDIFSKIEYLFYDKYPEFREKENNFFVNRLNRLKVKKNKSLEENKIENDDIILIENIEND